MTVRLHVLVLATLFIAASATLSAQEIPPAEVPKKPVYREDIQIEDPELQGTMHEMARNWFNGLSGFLAKFGIADLGAFRFSEFRLSEDNDLLSQDDQNYTHGLKLKWVDVGTKGKIIGTIDMDLWSLDTEDGFVPPKGYGAKPGDLQSTEGKTFFYELTDVRLKVESNIESMPGAFFRLGAGLQYFTNAKNFFGAAAQQRAYHADPSLGSDPNNDVYGDIRDFGVTVAGDVGMLFQSDAGRLFCQPEVGAEVSTNFDFSFIQASAEAGYVVFQDKKGRSILTVLTNFRCQQFANGGRDTKVGVETKLDLYVGKHWDFQLQCGAYYPLEQNEDLYHFVNDQDWIGNVRLCLLRRF